MGKDEINNKVLTLKKMKTGEQMQIKIEDFIIKITNKDNSILA
jgi:histidyl-tRNA synthetase